MTAGNHPQPLDLFPPGRDAGLARLHDFVPRSGRTYASQRNADPGPGRKANVSQLSPYIRYRLITEHEVVEAVLAEFAPSTAEKFIQEVLWRTYWKGWLQMRPQVWHDFLDERDRNREEVQANGSLATAWNEAEAGRTGIACFDDWVAELRATGYLHNHARMWFASIWIFTLKLPWALGADFFLRHLIDADPASNTLSWRWVAGIQTRGKTYLARAGNIARYTDGRFDANELGRQLADEAEPIREEPPPVRQPITPTDAVESGSRVLVLLHGDDLRGFEALPAGLDVAGVVVASGGHASAPWPFGDKARAFVRASAESAARQAEKALGAPVIVTEAIDGEALAERAGAIDAACIVTPDAPVGPIDDGLAALRKSLTGSGVQLRRVRRGWDTNAWPHATSGFFPFKKKIPDLLAQAGLT
ncbi:DNA photolyase FAD-binding protein [Wenzhouxiangella sp. XN79A]|uniref:FAD-binding domain-containing protein n=1 Tax=Wenzhouxiangella sp. XN79A TaxID=2724193 RepID=UPI00144AB055|nr:FAD-binding domain-containing protein [Wenzhouxiangella sp. XN79A]NKI33547.1 DNA photolyase FAD-binding protein [Wenzhouxiangella sp. XN79A]